jgi:hypothetical protein
MWQKFGLEEIYLGRSVKQHDLFQRENPKPEIDLTIPKVQPINLHEVKMVHIKKLGKAVPANNQNVPPYAHDLGMAIS